MIAPRLYVAEFTKDRKRVGKVHQSMRPATAKRNRSQYAAKCGRIIRAGLPVETDVAPADLCARCWPWSSLPSGRVDQ